MKRCPSCDFPNIDTNRACFKCNTVLDAVMPSDSDKESKEITVAYPTEEEKALLIYGNTTPYTNTALEELRMAAEVQTPIKTTSVPQNTAEYTTPLPLHLNLPLQNLSAFFPSTVVFLSLQGFFVYLVVSKVWCL